VSTLVFLEHHEGELLKPSLGVLSRAAELDGDVAGVVLGSDVRDFASGAGAFGA
jgi:electron transfer flavoprotein alpha subunit